MHSKFETVNRDGYSIVDNLTGELHEFKQIKKVSYDDFLLVFLNTIPEMYKLQGKQLKMLLACWKFSTFNPRGENSGNHIYNNGAFKEYVRNTGLDISDSTIDVYMSQLTKLGFLVKVYRGDYILNPKYFFKGTHKDASKMSLTFEVND